MSKQDRQGVRTPADLERKYTFADINKTKKAGANTASQVVWLAAATEQYAQRTDAAIADTELKVNAALAAANEAQKTAEAAALRAYPIGAIFMSFDNTDPALVFGGTWEQLDAPVSGAFAWKRVEDEEGGESYG